MARVTGIGGVFLRSKDPKRLTAWYAEHLRLPVTEWGISFDWKDEVPAGTGTTAWSTFADDTKYFGDDPRQAMINYRVDDMDALLTQLAAAGVWVDPNRQDEAMESLPGSKTAMATAWSFGSLWCDSYPNPRLQDPAFAFLARLLQAMPVSDLLRPIATDSHAAPSARTSPRAIGK